jgi:AbrB family looped-hinge helix DNA binding protein
MATGRISEKGQVTIPKPLREAFGIRAGDRLEFVAERDGIKVRRRLDEDPFARLRGSLKLPASVDELIDEMRGGPYVP